MKITIEIDQKSITSLAGGIGALRALAVQRTFEKDDLERIKELFKQIEQEYQETMNFCYNNANKTKETPCTQ